MMGPRRIGPSPPEPNVLEHSWLSVGGGFILLEGERQSQGRTVLLFTIRSATPRTRERKTER
jgi:hypothetical protein